MPPKTLPRKKASDAPRSPTKKTPRASNTAAASKTSSPPAPSAKSHKAPDQKTTNSLLREAAAQVGDSDLNTVVKEATAIEGKAASGGALDRFLDDIRLMLAMVGAYVSRRYREIPIGTITAVAGTLLYVLAPLDFIPDFIPAAGLIDDAAVVRACLKLVGYDIRKFRAWKARRA